MKQECAVKDHTCRFAYAFRGEYPVYHRLLHRGKRISAVTGICTTGLVAVELKKGNNNGIVFTTWKSDSKHVTV